MRRSGRLFIVLGVVLALAAVLLIVVALAGGDSDNDQQAAAQTKPSDVAIVQAKREIPPHTVLKAEDLESVIVKSDTVGEDVAKDVSQVIGFAYSADLVEGQRVLLSQLELSGVAEELEPGRRAVSLPATQNNLVAGLIRQDDRVDVVYEFNALLEGVYPSTPVETSGRPELTGEVVVPPFGEQPDPPGHPFPGEPGSRTIVTDVNDGNPISKIVLQDIRVLRVITADASQSTGGASDDGDYLVLDVDPAQAEVILMMQQAGEFQIILRNPNDRDIANTPGVNFELLVDGYKLPIPKAVRIPLAGAQ